MASVNLPFLSPSTSESPSTFWSRKSASLKQGIKTGLAETIAYAIYAGWSLPQGYWAVFAALVVTQTNLGTSWKVALYRTIGSASGAVAAATPYINCPFSQRKKGVPDVSSFFSSLAVQSQWLQAQGSLPFWSRHLRRS
jgi:hypothetical protein